jgi:hypothetical protein
MNGGVSDLSMCENRLRSVPLALQASHSVQWVRYRRTARVAVVTNRTPTRLCSENPHRAATAMDPAASGKFTGPPDFSTVLQTQA